MNIYVGMDISLQTTHLCIVDTDGILLHEGSANSDVLALDRFLHQHTEHSAVGRIVLETGQLSTPLFHGLTKAGWPVVCIDARHAHGVLKAQRIKSDRNDARGLAQMARTGWHRTTHVKSEASLSIRISVQGRKQLVRQRCDLENHIRGILKSFGIKLGIVTALNFPEKVLAAISTCDPVVQKTMRVLLLTRKSIRAQESILDKQCKRLAKSDEVCRRLMSVPGVGPLTALTFKTEIDDPGRFVKSRDVGVHLGLTPRRYASGEIDRSGGISKCGNRSTRTALYEAAQCLLTRSKKWSVLKAWGVALAKRRGFKTAVTALARKLATVLHRMWVDGTEFKFGRELQNA